MDFALVHTAGDSGSQAHIVHVQGVGEEETYMVACPTHTQTLLSRLPESEWPSALPDATSLPRTAPACLLSGAVTLLSERL